MENKFYVDDAENVDGKTSLFFFLKLKNIFNSMQTQCFNFRPP